VLVIAFYVAFGFASRTGAYTLTVQILDPERKYDNRKNASREIIKGVISQDETGVTRFVAFCGQGLLDSGGIAHA